jgi:biotin carboxyl carrier protein
MRRKKLYLFIIALAGITSCNSKKDAPAETAAAPQEVKTPVTVTTVQTTTLDDSIQLNATSVFLQNNYIKSAATGYIKSVDTKLGAYVETGKVLFIIETKESLVIGNSISSLDSSFKFTGANSIKSAAHGYVTQLSHQVGDYVQDGEQLAVISDMNSFAFLLNLPYELRPYVLNKKTVDLILPDGVHLRGNIISVMPIVDSLSQTQPVVIKVDSKNPIPQNLIAKVHIVKNVKNNAQTLPKSAILSDEAQTSFWVMKMMDSATAVKVNIKKGLELNNKVEILDPLFSKNDLILVTGNYGLSDTAKVIIEKE